MEELTWQEKLTKALGKYRYVLLVLALGLALMALPEGREEAVPQAAPVFQSSMEEKLEEILSQIRGVGKVSVLLTEAAGPETVYQRDREQSDSANGSSLREETLIITGTDRQESGLVLQTLPPVYQGAVIVCQGGDQPAVRLAVVDAVSKASGLSADRITVLKMK